MPPHCLQNRSCCNTDAATLLCCEHATFTEMTSEFTELTQRKYHSTNEYFLLNPWSRNIARLSLRMSLVWLTIGFFAALCTGPVSEGDSSPVSGLHLVQAERSGRLLGGRHRGPVQRRLVLRHFHHVDGHNAEAQPEGQTAHQVDRHRSGQSSRSARPYRTASIKQLKVFYSALC